MRIQTTPVLLLTLLLAGCFRLGLDRWSTDAEPPDGGVGDSDATRDSSEADSDLQEESDVSEDGDAPDDADLSGDADLSESFILSITELTNSDGSSYVEIDVDWDRGLAYLSTQEPGVCFDVVDISNENNPAVLRRMGPLSTPPTTCDMSRGLQLFDSGTKLLVGSHSPGVLEAWDLGPDPRALDYIQIAQIDVGHVRRVAFIEDRGSSFVFYMSVRGGVRTFSLEGASIVPLQSWTGTDNQADAAVVDLSYFLTASWIADAPISIIDISTMTLANTVDMSNGVNENGLWSTTVSADQTRAFFGGWVSAFLSYNTLGSAPPSSTRRIDNDSTYRDAIFVEDNGRMYLYALRRDLVLDVFDATDVNTPHLVFQTPLSLGHIECYGLRANTQTRRIIMITSAGEMIVAHMDRMIPATQRYPDL